MATPPAPDTDQLLDRVRSGDPWAREQLFARHRERLRRMVAVRIDERLARRVDPSDVVQDTLATAAQRLPAFLQGPAQPFYPWLRQIAWNRLVDLYRRHILAGRRSVDREQSLDISDSSVAQLAQELLPGGEDPVDRVLRAELRSRVKATLGRLRTVDREILILRHLEQLPISHCGEVLGISREAAKKRYVRAVRRLRRLLEEDSGGPA